MKETKFTWSFFPLACCVLLLFCGQTHAQHKNTIAFEASSRVFPNLEYFTLPELYIGDQFGVFFERKISKRQSLSVGFTKWNNFVDNARLDGITIVNWANYDGLPIGKILYRQNYKMVDVSYKYAIYQGRKSDVKAGLGISCSYGTNIYLDSVSEIPNNYAIYRHKKTEAYIGFVPTLSYDHYLFKRRLSIGADLHYRKYLSMFATQIDYGLHLACNF